MNEASNKREWIAETLCRVNASTATPAEVRARLRELGEAHGVSEAIRRSLEAIDPARAAQRRQTVRKAAEAIVARVEEYTAAGQGHDTAVQEAYSLAFAALSAASRQARHGPTLWPAQKPNHDLRRISLGLRGGLNSAPLLLGWVG